MLAYSLSEDVSLVRQLHEARMRTVAVVTLVVMFLFLSLPAKGQLVRVGGEVRVNQTIFARISSNRSFTANAPLGTHSTIHLWGGSSEQEETLTVRVFDDSGAPLSDEFIIWAGINLRGVDVSRTESHVLVVWSAGSTVFGKRFDIEGRDLNPMPFTIEDQTGDGPPAVVHGDTGSLVIWSGFDNVQARAVLDDGTMPFPAYLVSDEPNVFFFGSSSDVADLGDGLFLATWWDEGAFRDLDARVVSLDGPIGPTFLVEPLVDVLRVQACSHEGGGIITWDRKAMGPVESVGYDEAGAILSEPVAVFDPVRIEGQRSQSMSCNADGTFAVVARGVNQNEGRGAGLFGAVFSPQKVGFRIDTVESHRGGDPAVAFVSESEFIVSWRDCEDADEQECSIFSQRFSTDSAVSVCEGDCDEDGSVTVAELVRGVRAGLSDSAEQMKQCLSLDSNLDYHVTINELVVAVQRALGGCGSR